MFVGHYGVSFAARRVWPRVPLWVWFIAVQLLDILWAPFILLGVERVRIVPGITASNPLDLYYMPWTHSLVAALGWSVAAMLAWRAVRNREGWTPATFGIGLAVFSHWVLDFVVHRPDLPLYGNTAKVGLGLWNHPALAFSLEAGLLVAGALWYLGARTVRPVPVLIFAVVMLAVQGVVFFGAPPATPAMAAMMAFGSYALFAFLAYLLEHRYRQPAVAASA